MDNRSEIREFLANRRAKITPDQVGLSAGGTRRRFPGSAREEVAVLAGVSTEWYTRLEKGHISGVSEEVLEAVARALRLDEAERIYLFDLARAAKPARTPQRRSKATVRPSVQWLLDSMTSSAAFVRNRRMDILAINSLGRALFSPMFDDERRPVNIARFHFLNPRAHDFYPDWVGSHRPSFSSTRGMCVAGRSPRTHMPGSPRSRTSSRTQTTSCERGTRSATMSVTGPGGIVWTQAGSGLVHEEMAVKLDGDLHLLQLFVNLTRNNKLAPPRVFGWNANEVPEWHSEAGDRVRVLVGSFADKVSPLAPTQPFRFLDVRL